MSKGFWIVLAFVFGITTTSLTLYVYTEEMFEKATNEYSLEDYALPDNGKDCITDNKN